MLKILSCFLFAFLLMLSCSGPTATLNSLIQTNPLFKQFIKQTGFKGEFTLVNDGRIFTKLHGTFRLPEPKDSLILQSNTDKIANALMSVYKEQGANYTLKRMNYDGSTHACQYIQYWKSFYLVNQPHYLLITYHPKSKRYTIHNTLYQGKISIPKQVANLSYLMSKYHIFLDVTASNTNLDLPDAHVDTDSLNTVYDILDDYSYEHNWVNNTKQIFLNLYPASDKNSSREFTLQWKYHNPSYDKSDFDIDAQTGKFMRSSPTSAHKTNPHYPFIFHDYYGNASDVPFYRGFYVNIPFMGLQSDRYFIGGLYPNKIQYYINSLTEVIIPVIYSVPYFLRVLNYKLPDCVISPQTALAIEDIGANPQFVWTELSNISGTKDYAPANVDFHMSHAGLWLELFPSRVKNNPYKFKYKLIWTFNYTGNPAKIDAVTGESLNNENYNYGMMY